MTEIKPKKAPLERIMRELTATRQVSGTVSVASFPAEVTVNPPFLEF